MFLSPAQLPLTQWSLDDYHQMIAMGLLGDRQVELLNGIVADLHDSEPEPDIAIVKPLGPVYRQRHPYPEDIFWVKEILG